MLFFYFQNNDGHHQPLLFLSFRRLYRYYIKNTVKLLLKSYFINGMLIIIINILITTKIDIFILLRLQL